MKATRALYTDFLQHDNSARSGTHLSDIIKFILRTRDPDTYGKPIDEGTRRLWELGFAVEEAIGDAFARKHFKSSKSCLIQVPVTLDGVIMTPDAFLLLEWLIREFKYTRMTSNREITDLMMRHYLWQIKAYCLARETLKAELIVVHANGDYTNASPVIPYKWSLRFSAHELDSNWRMILVNKRRMEQEAA